MRTASRRSSNVISRAEKLQRSMRMTFGGDPVPALGFGNGRLL